MIKNRIGLHNLISIISTAAIADSSCAVETIEFTYEVVYIDLIVLIDFLNITF